MSIFSNSYENADEEAPDYVVAVLELVGDRDPVDILGELPDALEQLVEGVSEGALRLPEAEGKWSMLEVLAHLADSELVWAYRLRIALAEADPVLTGYDQDRWAEHLRYRSWDPKATREGIRFLRGRNLTLLSGLSEEELARSGRHTERGEESVRHMVRLYAGHDLVHRRQLERIRARVSP